MTKISRIGKNLEGIDSPILVFRFGDLENYFSPEELGQEYENIPQCLNTLINREKNLLPFSLNLIFQRF